MYIYIYIYIFIYHRSIYDYNILYRVIFDYTTLYRDPQLNGPIQWARGSFPLPPRAPPRILTFRQSPFKTFARGNTHTRMY